MAEVEQFEERTIKVNRVSKVVKGGRRFSFTALMVIGDGKGRVGLGYGKAKEAGLAVQKGIEEARKNLFDVPLAGIDHRLSGHRQLRRRTRPDEAGRPRYRRHRRAAAARAILEMAGVKDIIAKSLGSSERHQRGPRHHRRSEAAAPTRGARRAARQAGRRDHPLGTLRAYRERQREGDLFKVTEG